MGGTEFLSAMAAVNAGLGAVNTVSGIAQGNAQAKYQAQQAELQRRAQQAQRDQQLKQLEENRKAQTARARASMGAAGTGSATGSGAAVIGQLNRKADENRLQLLNGFALDDEMLSLARPGSSSLDNLLTLGQSLSKFGSALSDWSKAPATPPPTQSGSAGDTYTQKILSKEQQWP